MKNSLRILNTLILSITYCFAIIIYTNSNYNVPVYQSNSQEHYILDISANLFCYTFQSENSQNNYTNLTYYGFKKLFIGIGEISKLRALHYDVSFSQYNKFSKNFLTHYQKSKFIFPFHYFW